MRSEHLDGDIAVQLAVETLEDHAHSAAADNLQHVVIAQAAQHVRLVGCSRWSTVKSASDHSSRRRLIVKLVARQHCGHFLAPRGSAREPFDGGAARRALFQVAAQPLFAVGRIAARADCKSSAEHGFVISFPSPIADATTGLVPVER